jgi:hypothetical protein
MVNMIGLPTIVIGVALVVNIVGIAAIQATGNVVPQALLDALPLLVGGLIGIQVPSGRKTNGEE